VNGVVVGIDESRGAERALAWALEEAERRQTPLTVVTVCPSMAEYGTGAGTYYIPPPRSDLERAKATAEAAVEKVFANRGRPAEIDYTVTADFGNVSEVLLRYAATADQIVVGSRGNGGFKRLLLGSVSSAVVHHARCPVTVVPVERPHHGET
jgi:nucleotide-binding universal stress UspA family protein